MTDMLGWPPGLTGQLRTEFYDLPGVYRWTRPSAVVLLYYRLCGSGAGGASGQIGTTGTSRSGGAGGSGGELVEGWLLGSEIPNSGQIVVPGGGAGGSGSAQNGSNGATASFCDLVFASHGLGQAASGGFLYEGRPLTWTGDSSSNSQGGAQYGRIAGAGGSPNAGGNAVGSGFHAGGGGGGGGGPSANTSTAGGQGGRGFSRRKLAVPIVGTSPSAVSLSTAGGTTGGAAPGSGAYGSGDGGGGGAYRSGFPSQGGAGGWPGGGGGGAGAADTSQTSVGGNGGGGMVRLWLWVPT